METLIWIPFFVTLTVISHPHSQHPLLLPAPRLPRRRREMLLPFLKRFGKTALALELTALGSFYYIFHDINTGGNEARIKWEQRGASFLIDALYKVTGDERVIAHRRGETAAEKKAD
eukprot:scaffold2556_cov207-Alexandrium_tamarense.AAC.7